MLWSKPVWSLMYFATCFANIPPKLHVLLDLQLSLKYPVRNSSSGCLCCTLLQEWMQTHREMQGNSGYPSSQQNTALMRGLITQENGMPGENRGRDGGGSEQHEETEVALASEWQCLKKHSDGPLINNLHFLFPFGKSFFINPITYLPPSFLLMLLLDSYILIIKTDVYGSRRRNNITLRF